MKENLLMQFSEVSKWIGLRVECHWKEDGINTARWWRVDEPGWNYCIIDADAPDDCNDQPRFIIALLEAIEAKGCQVDLTTFPGKLHRCEVSEFAVGTWWRGEGSTRFLAVLSAATAACKEIQKNSQEEPQS